MTVPFPWNPAMLRLISKGLALYRAGRFEDAVSMFDWAISIDPDNSDAWSNKGYALMKAGKITDAVKTFETALSINPQNQDARMGRILAIRTIWPSYHGE